jgi:DNA repair exonuclease SbcCD ATPase subunit
VDDVEDYIWAYTDDHKVYKYSYKWLESESVLDTYLWTNVPLLHKSRIAWYEAKLKDLKAQYDENVAAQEKTVTDLEKEIAKIKEALAGYKAMETDYLAYGEELVNAKKAYYEALKDETDAKNVQSEAQAAYNALNALLTAKVYVDENGNQKTTEQLETLITQKKKDIIAAYEQLEELYNQYEMFGRKDAAGKYEVEYIAQLKIDIEKLEAELAILEAQIESYAAELEILLEELGGEPDVE